MFCFAITKTNVKIEAKGTHVVDTAEIWHHIFPTMIFAFSLIYFLSDSTWNERKIAASDKTAQN